MKKKMVEQTTGLTDEEIRKAQKKKSVQSASRLKQAIMKEAGYASGTRAELFSEQTALRGEYLANMANTSANSNQSEDVGTAKELVTGLNVQQRGGSYRGGEIAQRMGLKKTQEEILSGTNEIHELAERRRVERVQKEQQRQQKEQQKQQQRQQKEQARQAKQQQKEQERRQKELARQQRAAARSNPNP